MFKKLKMFLVALVMLPCAIFLPACGEPEDPKDPPSNTLTTEQKNTAFGKLKETLSEDYSEKSDNASVVSTTTGTSVVSSIDYDSTMDDSAKEMVEAMVEAEMSGTRYSKTEIGYKNDGTGYMLSSRGDTAETTKPENKTYFVKEGTKIIKYNLDFNGETGEFNWGSANYVSPEHAKFDAVNGYLGELAGLADTALESEDFDDFVDNMALSYLEAEFDELDEDKISIDIDLTKDNGVYTISGDCTMTDMEMTMMGMGAEVDGTATYTLKFTDDALLEYGLVLDMDVSMDMDLSVMTEGYMEGAFSMTMSSDSEDKVVFSDTFDSSKMASDFSEYEEELGEITNANARVIFMIDGLELTSDSFDFAEGYEAEDITMVYNGFRLEDVTWYTDEACTKAFTSFTDVKSFDELKLYAKNVAIPTGFACVKELNTYFGGDEIRYYEIEYNSVFTFDSWYEDDYDIYVTIDNGTRTLCTAESITLEDGRTYLIEYVEKA